MTDNSIMPIANGSSPSSVDGSLDKFAQDFVATEKSEPTGLDSFAQQVVDEEFVKTQAAARWARKFDPQSYAEAAKLAPGIPPEMGIRQLQLLRESSALQAYSDIFQKSPALRGYFSEKPEDLAYAKPDELDNISGLEYLGKATYQSIKAGFTQTQVAFAQNRISEGRGTPQDEAFVTNYEGDRTFGARGFWDEALVLTGQQVGPLAGTLIESIDKGLKGAVGGGIFGGVTGAATGSVVPGAGTAAGAAAGSLAGAALGGRAGAIAGALNYQQKLQTGLSRLYFSRLRDENGKPLEPQLQEFAAQVSGIGGALLESISEGQLLSVVPGGKKALGLLGKEGMGEALKIPGVRNAVLTFLKNVGETGATEISTEMLQQGLQVAAEEYAKAESQGNFRAKSASEIADEIGQAGYQALQVSAILGPLAAGTRFGSDVLEIARSKREHDRLNQTIQAVEGNELLDRAPQVAQALIDRSTGDQKLYIPADALKELYQSQGLDLYGPPIPNWRERVDQALAVSGDIETSLGEFVTYLGRNPKENPLLSLVRTSPQGYTQAEIAPYQEALAPLLQSEVARATAVEPSAPDARAAAQPVEAFPELDTLKKEILRAGFNPQATEQYATMLGSFFQTMANRTGKTASEFFNEFALSVSRGLIRNVEEGDVSPDTFFQGYARTPEFAQWFGDSKILDDRGQPQVVYHGSSNNFSEFKPGGGQFGGEGIYFSPDPKLASTFSDMNPSKDGSGPSVYPVYLRVKNPLVIEGPSFLERAKAKLTGKRVDNRGNQSSFFSRRQIEEMKAQGYDGVINRGTNEIVAFDPEQIKSTLNIGTFDPSDPNILRQGEKGSITFDGTKAVIRLFDGNDMSTLLHEAGHFFLNTLRATKDASPELAADWDKVANYLGVKEGKISREQHEKFARTAEAYFFEGKAPAPELRSAFESFARWLKTLYRRITQLGGPVDPEIRGVFDRMLVTEERIQELQADTAYAPLFKDAESLGLDTKDYIEYQKLVEDLRTQEQAKARERIVGQAERLSKGWRGEIQKQLAKDAEERLAKTAPYNNMQALKDGKITINVKKLSERYGKDALSKFPRNGLKASGMDPQVAAELLGYPSVDDMVYDFTQAPPLKEAAKQAAAVEMSNRYGENFNNSEVMNLAIQRQMADEGRLLLLGKELKALSRKAGRETSDLGPKQIAQNLAKTAVYSKKVGELNEKAANANVRRAASAAEAAMVKGDWNTAAEWKRKQLVAQAVANEVANASAVVEKIRDKAARYTRTTPASVDPSFMEQIRALVEQYDFARVSKKKLTRRQGLREFLDAQAADGLVPVGIPDRLLRDAAKVNWKELSVEDLIGLGETLDNLEHMGRLKNKLKIAGKAREEAEVISEIVGRVGQRKGKPKQMKTYTEEKQNLIDRLQGFHSMLLKPEQLVEWLDLGDIEGPMAEYVFNPIAEAQNKQNDLLAEYTSKVNDIMSKWDTSEIFNIPSLQTRMTKEEILAVALNTGNESNKKKLMEGELWTAQNLEEVLSHLSKEDWDGVQKVWDVLSSLWTKVAAMEKELTGVAPPEVQAREVETPHGTYKGGYYPVKYDFQASRGLNLIQDTTPVDKQFANGLFALDPSTMTPGTSHKFTVARTKVAKPIDLNLRVISAHLHDVIHDLSYRVPVRNAYKILWHPDVKKAIAGAENDHVVKQLQDWLRGVATERVPVTDSASRFIARVRTGATMYGMGYRLTTAVAQITGFLPGMYRTGARNMTAALLQMVRNPVTSWNMVNELSGEMRHRFNQQDRDIYDSTRKKEFLEGPLGTIKAHAFTMLGVMDKAFSTMTWLAAYRQQMQVKPDHEVAIRYADRTVRLTQGTGSVKDMAQIMNKGELLKLFTMFYSFFSAQYNMQVDLTRKTHRDITAGEWGNILSERLPQFMYLVALPAVAGAALTGQGPEEDENPAAWAARKVALYPLAAVPFVREAVSVLDNGFAGKFTPASKFLDESSKGLKALFGGDKTLEERIEGSAKPLANAAAIYFKLPAGQAISTIDTLWKGLENQDFEAKDLYLGRRDK